VSSYDSKLARLEALAGERIERHDKGRSLAELRAYDGRPLDFFRDELRVEPWAAQEETVRSVLANRKTLVTGGVGVGKDAVAAWLALYWAYCVPGGVVLATSSTARQICEQFMRKEVGAAFRRAKLPGELLTTGLRVGDETRILAFTSGASEAYRGYHPERALVIISEASGVDAAAWAGLSDCAVGADDRQLAYGNPVSPTGPFFDAYRSPGWHKLKVSVLSHPNILERRRVIPGGPEVEWLEEQDPASSFYAASVLGEFPADAVNALVTREWLERAAALHASGALQSGPGESYRCALDVARSTLGDQSCLCITRGSVVRGFKLWREPNARLLRDHVVRELHALRIYRGVPAGIPGGMVCYPDGLPPATGQIIIDARGVGGPVADEMRSDGWSVTMFDSGARAKKAERFANRRVEAYWTVREKLEKGTLAMAYDADLWEELMAMRWTENHKRQVEIEGKKGLRRTLGRSPDKADALAMAIGSSIGTISWFGAQGQW